MDKLKVLVADDEILALQGMVSMVRTYGELEVVGAASNGQEALDILRAKPVDILLTDIRMPKMNGIELIQHVEEEGIRILAIIVSAYDDREYLQQAIRSSIVYDYVNKPVDRTEFTELLHTVSAYRRRQLARRPIQELVNLIINRIKEGNLEYALQYFEMVWRDFSSKDLQSCIQNACEMMMKIGLSIRNEGDTRAAIFQIYESVHRVEQCATADEVEAYVREYIRKNSFKNVQQERKITALVASCLDIVNRRLGDKDLSISEAARELEVTSNYLSGRFSRDMGISFTKYVTMLRIERAKEYLGDVRLKIYEVSAMVGFDDVRYFDKVFKEREGIRPSEFRNKIITKH